MPQKNDTSTQRTEKGGTLSLRRGLAAAAALPRAVLRCRSFFKSLFSKGEDRPLPQRTLLAAAICLPLAAICLSTVTENAFFIQWEERGRGMDKAYAALRCRLSAGLGDVEAQFRLGKLYAEGHGLPRDEEKSLFWYGEAAEQGHAGAQRYLAFEAYSLTWAEMARWRQKLADQGDVRAKCLLGDMYAKGRGVPQDKAKAACWYRKAALRGHDEAAFELGSMYAAGDGVPQDKAEVAYWYRKAAEQENVRAQWRLGNMYAAGDGVPQDKAEAARWFYSMAKSGSVEAQWRLSNMYASGEGLPKDTEKALDWCVTAVERGAFLGPAYFDVRRVEKEAAEAAGWLRKLGEQGDAVAQYCLGFIHSGGEVLLRDRAEAARWFRKAAEQGHAEAQWHLGNMLDTGEGVPQDRAEAAAWFRKAAEQGTVRAQWRLGNMYAAGEGVPQDKAEAAAWLRKAAERWNNRAQWQLGVMYAAGDGVPQDTKTALYWLNRAVEQGISYEGLVYFSAQGEPKDKSRAIDSLRELVKTRDRDEARWYSDLIYSGNSDMAQNMAEAVDWLRKAAEQGFVKAQYILGRMYADASEPPDTAEAIRWYRMAAEQGHDDAQMWLGILLQREGKRP